MPCLSYHERGTKKRSATYKVPYNRITLTLTTDLRETRRDLRHIQATMQVISVGTWDTYPNTSEQSPPPHPTPPPLSNVEF